MSNLPIFRTLSAAAALVFPLLMPLPLAADVPRVLDYQGRIVVAGVNFDGVGQFKFSLVDPAGTSTYWSHDGTAVNGGAPVSAITLPVSKGLYSLQLGNTAIPNMLPLHLPAFEHEDVHLRMWFSDGVTGFQLLTPDRHIAAVAYALVAADVADGAVTSAKLAPGAVTAEKIAPGSITADRLAPGVLPANTLLASFTPDDPALLALGYAAVQTFPGGAWSSPSAGTPPSARTRHTAVWTGEKMIVWGGEVSGILSGQGGAYDPAAVAWTLLNSNAASPARSDHTAVWTGGKMIVWGGRTASGESGTGALYNPVNQSWLAAATAGAPEPRKEHSAVWTGEKMIVWGGGSAAGTFSNGGIFTPSAGSGTWAAIPAAGPVVPNTPAPRRLHTAVWAGGRMIIFGGENADGLPLNDGAAWDPGTGAWTPLPAAGAPSARFGHTAVWTGTRMIVFGGAASRINSSPESLLNDGAAWDSTTNTWMPLSAAGAPEGRTFHSAVWTGKEMLITGGEGVSAIAVTTGAAYNSLTNTWRALPAAASGGGSRTAVWSGQLLLTFGAGGFSILDPKPPLTLYGRF